MRLVRLIAEDDGAITEGTRTLLTSIAQFTSVREGDSTACSQRLHELQRRNPHYVSMVVVDGGGGLWCSSTLSFEVGQNFSDRLWYKAAIERRGFAVGGYQIGRLTGRPQLAFAQAILDDGGKPQAVIVATLDIAWFTRFAERAALPSGAALTVIDREGTILFRHPDPRQQYEGKKANPTYVGTILDHQQGVGEWIGLDGRPRFYGFAPLGGRKDTGIYIAIGFDRQTTLEQARTAFLTSAMALGGICLFAFVIAWFGAERMIVRPVHRLRVAAKQLSGGNWEVRLGPPYPAGELGGLARVFDDTAQSLKETHDALEASRGASHRSAERLSLLHAIDTSILAGDPPEAAATAVAELLSARGTFTHVAVLRRKDAGGTLAILGAAAHGTATTDGQPLDLTTQHLGSAPCIPENSDSFARLFGNPAPTWLWVPFEAGGPVEGGLVLGHAGESVGQEAQETANEIGDQLMIALRHDHMRRQVDAYARDLEKRVADRTAELEEVNNELMAFAYSVSHDLRAPLRAARGFSEALLEDYGSSLEGEARDFVTRIIAAVHRMEALIDDLLSYSRLTRADITLQPTDLAEVTGEVLAECSGEIAARGATVAVDGDLPRVVGFAPVLRQVMINLVGNALKFVAPGTPPRVMLRAESRGPHLRLWFEDNGIGIAPEYQQRIFRVFERLHGHDAYPGTGIGLALVQKGMARMNGSAGVESAPGEGSRFWIEIPRAADRARLCRSDAVPIADDC